MASQTDIVNLALLKMAQSNLLPSMADESKAADIMNRVWAPVRDLVLEARVWPWALKSQALALSVDAVQPGWAYRYAQPNDCITGKAVTDANGLRQVRVLTSFTDPDYLARWGFGNWAFDWQQSCGETETTINTDVQEAFLVYVVRVEDTARYSASFVNTLAARLAVEAAPGIIGEVGLNSKPALMQEYNTALTESGSNAANQSLAGNDWTTDAVRVRG